MDKNNIIQIVKEKGEPPFFKRVDKSKLSLMLGKTTNLMELDNNEIIVQKRVNGGKDQFYSWNDESYEKIDYDIKKFKRTCSISPQSLMFGIGDEIEHQFFYACDYNKVKTFGSCKNYSDFLRKITKVDKSQWNFYEITRTEKPVREFYDIDIKNPKDLCVDNHIKVFFESWNKWKLFLNDNYDVNIESDWRVLHSHKYDGDALVKISFHIFNIKNHFKTVPDQKTYQKRYLEWRLEPVNEKYSKLAIDMSVYNNNSELRLENHTKIGETRYLQREHKDISREPTDFLACYVDDKSVLFPIDNLEIEKKCSSSIDFTSIISGVIPDVKTEDGEKLFYLIQEKILEGKHSLCDKENEKLLTYPVFRDFCFKFIKLFPEFYENNIDMFFDLYRSKNDYPNLPDTQMRGTWIDLLQNEDYDYRVETLHKYAKENDKYKSVFPFTFKDRVNSKKFFPDQKILRKDMKNRIKIEKLETDYVLPYDDVSVFPTEFIRATQGKGKTHQCIEYEKGKEDMNSLYLTMTRALCFNSSQRLNFTNYTEMGHSISFTKSKKIVSTLESIYKYNPETNEIPDVLYLDEWNTIRKNLFGSTTRKNIYDILAVLKFLIRHSKKVIVMDADLTEDDCRLIRSLREHKGQAVFKKYITKKKTGVNYYFYEQKEQLRDRFLQKIKEGKRVVMCGFSPAMLEDLHTYIIQNKLLPEEKVLLIYKETEQKLKTEILKNFNDLEKYDCFLYSPTCMIGCNFDKIHFDEIFAYHTPQCDLTNKDFLQLLRRIRHTKDNRVNIYCHSKVDINYELDVDNIKTMLKGVSYDYNDDGKKVYTKDFIYYCKLLNDYEKSMSKRYFFSNLIFDIQQAGGTVLTYETDQMSDKKVDKIMKSISKERVEKECSEIVNSRMIDDVEAKRIENKIMFEDISIEKGEITALKRKNFLEFYGLSSFSSFSCDFYKKFKQPKLKLSFVCLSHMKSLCENLDIDNVRTLLIKQLKLDKTQLKQKLKNSEEKTMIILNQNKTNKRCLFVVEILMKCGLTMDEKSNDWYEKKEDLMNVWNKNKLPLFLNTNYNKIEILKDRGVKKQKDFVKMNFKSFLEYVNSILVWIDAKIVSNNKISRTERGNFMLQMTKDFNYSGKTVHLKGDVKECVDTVCKYPSLL